MPSSPSNGFFPILPASPSEETGSASALYQHVRAILTGDPFGMAPATNVLAFYAADVLPELFRAYPCLSENGAGLVVNPGMDANDLRYYYRAASLDIALRILSAPGGSQYEAMVVRTSTDNVERTIQNSRTLTDALAFLTTEKARMLARISCIAASRASAAPIALFDVVGHRRSVQRHCGDYVTGPVSYYDSSWFWGGLGLGY